MTLARTIRLGSVLVHGKPLLILCGAEPEVNRSCSCASNPLDGSTRWSTTLCPLSHWPCFGIHRLLCIVHERLELFLGQEHSLDLTKVFGNMDASFNRHSLTTVWKHCTILRPMRSGELNFVDSCHSSERCWGMVGGLDFCTNKAISVRSVIPT